jgi:AcrR family transcriptional regulator
VLISAPPSSGLRARKKARTRLQIREAALRLFLEHGYEAVTAADIAADADVSLRTLFRYFPTKASLALPVDLGALVRTAFSGLGADDTVFDAIRDALTAGFSELSAMHDEHDQGGEHVRMTLARARDALIGEVTGIIGLLAELIGERWDRPPHDPLVQAAAGGVVGVALAAITADRDVGRPAALGILRVGMQGLEDGLVP